jgi:hypothetical protein
LDAIHSVNFIEKILATVLAKVSNFIPEAGIWMNTQRPEWNDANNALVGNGVSMVTLYYLRRFLAFFEGLLESSDASVKVSTELANFFKQVKAALEGHESLLSGAIDDANRKRVMDALGTAAADYRASIYNNGFVGTYEDIAISEVQEFAGTARKHLEHSIRANKREDGLYHAYNLMTVAGNEVQVSYLSEMLEGQVAILSSGYLNTSESLAVLDALKSSALFREDQYSYILYPNKELPRFVAKNIIPSEKAEKSELIKALVAAGNKQVVTKDCNGLYHFSGLFNNVDSLKAALKNVPDQYASLAAAEGEYLCTIFEEVFDHKSFTGRSGTFFGYEGLGSIYWHMVSKLLLAAYENTQQAIDEEADGATIGRLFDHYFEILAGIGAHKSPKLYGAFPTDPYSHTPGGKGAQQPGMTGQVKEDVLSRFGELGVRVKDGVIHFEPTILKKSEFLSAPHKFKYIDVLGNRAVLNLNANSLGFTVCQVPIVYTLAEVESIKVHTSEGVHEFAGTAMNQATSTEVFRRTNLVTKIEVAVIKK